MNIIKGDVCDGERDANWFGSTLDGKILKFEAAAAGG